MRLSKEELNKIMEENNVDRLWSFSRVNNYNQCSHSYYLTYIKKCQLSENIYSYLGNVGHEIIQDMIEGKAEYDDMASKFEDAILTAEILGLKFSPDQNKHKNTLTRYKDNMVHFFNNHCKLNYDIKIEIPITIKIDKHMFIGYIDEYFVDEEGYHNIIDFKSSTIYQGVKIKQNGRQLLLYALGLHQQGVPLDKIKIKWNFMKYTNISFKQKNGKIKTMAAERKSCISNIANYLRKDLKDNPDVDKLIEDAITFNTLDGLPQEIQDKYTFNDCYVDIPIDEEIIEELANGFNFLVDNIIEKEHSKNKEDAFNRSELLDKEVFYCSVLCSCKGNCRHYKQYTSKKFNNKKEKSDDDILNELLFG